MARAPVFNIIDFLLLQVDGECRYSIVGLAFARFQVTGFRAVCASSHALSAPIG